MRHTRRGTLSRADLDPARAVPRLLRRRVRHAHVRRALEATVVARRVVAPAYERGLAAGLGLGECAYAHLHAPFCCRAPRSEAQVARASVAASCLAEHEALHCMAGYAQPAAACGNFGCAQRTRDSGIADPRTVARRRVE
jgi:hypothetical protein